MAKKSESPFLYWSINVSGSVKVWVQIFSVGRIVLPCSEAPGDVFCLTEAQAPVALCALPGCQSPCGNSQWWSWQKPLVEDGLPGKAGVDWAELILSWNKMVLSWFVWWWEEFFVILSSYSGFCISCRQREVPLLPPCLQNSGIWGFFASALQLSDLLIQ